MADDLTSTILGAIQILPALGTPICESMLGALILQVQCRTYGPWMDGLRHVAMYGTCSPSCVDLFWCYLNGCHGG